MADHTRREVVRSAAVVAAGGFAAQLVGAAAATVLFRWLVPNLSEVADRVVVEGDADQGDAA